MENQNLADHLPLNQRAGFLEDNADAVEKMSYLKKFSSEEIMEMKNRLSDVSIDLNDIEEEKKAQTALYKAKAKPYVEEKKQLLDHIKNKSILVNEECYKFIDHEAGKVRFYNAIGDLVEERQIMPSERQTTIYSIKNGTNDN
ncbi:hypothetical protein [Albibacterium profundi]|uniref:Uncharacterized protein n=1 Tax=Albibacterium profundi TaxID=3134906 RepID=A0ABV5CF06_9SPHI